MLWRPQCGDLLAGLRLYLAQLIQRGDSSEQWRSSIARFGGFHTDLGPRRSAVLSTGIRSPNSHSDPECIVRPPLLRSWAAQQAVHMESN